ncbi:acyltransferase [Teredinibacter sp. KSP-S5-2]|uniref:acyltransferase family protein n=1 Tax=Teredinibacter sp. KSP-S5-2 TaxID=3034506 RepID=UPI0029345616|nr:acyltransferase [Teredinibacter sp. KSP-S5-2]WNO08383.1 acyltransferase [Teredinibacter sp. KSP-S5-2]
MNTNTPSKLSLDSAQFVVLDSLRGIAAVAVAYFHYNSNWAGYLAVDFFFVLSGFILTHSYLHQTRHDNSIFGFIVNRVARLYPLHIFTTITFALAIYITQDSWPSYGKDHLFTLFQQATLTQNIGFNPSGLTWNYPSWSISVEFWTGILFFILVKKSTKSSHLFFASLFLLIVIYNHTKHLDIHAQNFYAFVNSGVIRCLASFLLGILIYRAHKEMGFLQSKLWITLLELICLGLIFLVIFYREDKLNEADFFSPYIFALSILIFSLEGGLFSAMLKPLNFLGKISYSVYLNQITILIICTYICAKWPALSSYRLSIYLSLLTVFSVLTYIVIEKPLKKQIKKLYLLYKQRKHVHDLLIYQPIENGIRSTLDRVPLRTNNDKLET